MGLFEKPGNHGAQGQNRTVDTRIFSPLLYRLSYLGIDYLLLAALANIWTIIRINCVLDKHNIFCDSFWQNRHDVYAFYKDALRLVWALYCY